MKKHESVLTGPQRESLQINELMFHIIAPGAPAADEDVISLDEVVLSESQHQFFLKRLQDTATGNKYIFLPDAVTLRDKCVAIADKTANFVTISRQITSDFASHHKGNMSPGVFVIADVAVKIGETLHPLVFLVKLDHKKTISVSYKVVDGRKVAVMDDLPRALTESQSAVSKSALIDVRGSFAWDVLAWDRYPGDRPTRLSQYFEGFLGVCMHGTPGALTQTAYRAAREWAVRADVQLPEGLTKQVVKDRALDYLKGAGEFDTDGFIKSILRDSDSGAPELRSSLSDHLGDVGIAGQKFSPELRAISTAQRKTIYKAVEGVSVQYEDGAGASVVSVEWANKGARSGPATITIRTQNLTVNE